MPVCNTLKNSSHLHSQEMLAENKAKHNEDNRAKGCKEPESLMFVEPMN